MMPSVPPNITGPTVSKDIVTTLRSPFAAKLPLELNVYAHVRHAYV